ncbi:MAG: GHKL domain-containing protein [Crenarchaeota archaeon]|nr:MAG: GHKL domain-containing protein [Thermoproteota archaeon]RDJ34028.1 MAG: GHKL domain-containing protein [Thermoproteota archaeon]RDJ36857.1 MAG: GHKL domain-containing protein [Thermoproteota archaeon]RDJ37608.1 MAG: GHKL domain-containing protein [Thermoproteota archaeon]
MQASEESNFKLLDEISKMTVRAQKDLELAKQELDEKQILLEDLAHTSSQKIMEAAKTNRDLKSKVDFLQELSHNLDDENKRLQQTNAELQSEKARYNKLNEKLKRDLESLIVREKELEIQQKRLSFTVEQKSKELAKASKMATVGTLASRLAHDLRNPLSVIKGTVEILKIQHTDLDKSIQEKLRRIESATKKISYQIEDVLDFVRQSELHLKRVPLSEIMDSSISNIMVPQSVKIVRDYRNVVVNCDSKKLEAVFTNLITNGIQAMNESGEILIKILDDGENAMIKFTDSGNGLTKATMEKMFEPLYTTKETGTGLGLSICKNIVEQHGGTIDVTLSPTTFTLRIPKSIRGFYKAN